MPRGIYDRSNQTNWKPNSGRFQKGEHRNPDTEFKKGQHFSPETEFKPVIGYTGERNFYTPEFIQKQSESHKGQHSSPQTEFQRGNHYSPETEFKELVPGGVSTEEMLLRASPEYIQWRTAVYKRDNYTCQHCGVKGGRLEAHHIKSFAEYPELRFDVGNGITLHKSYHRGGDKKCLVE